MFFSWTKQFLIATGFFTIVLTGQTVNMVVKEKRVTEKALEDAQRAARVTMASQVYLN